LGRCRRVWLLAALETGASFRTPPPCIHTISSTPQTPPQFQPQPHPTHLVTPPGPRLQCIRPFRHEAPRPPRRHRPRHHPAAYGAALGPLDAAPSQHLRGRPPGRRPRRGLGAAAGVGVAAAVVAARGRRRRAHDSWEGGGKGAGLTLQRALEHPPPATHGSSAGGECLSQWRPCLIIIASSAFNLNLVTTCFGVFLACND
jgi:hypothetical protein